MRHNTLTVLTHLVLNDMVKVRGQVSEMALCLEDADERIQDMARLFFGEFKLKQQGIYTHTHTHIPFSLVLLATWFRILTIMRIL